MIRPRTSRDTYQFTADFFRPDGRVTFADFASARKFASQISAHRTQPVPASDLYAMALIDEALRVLVNHYAPPALMNTAVSHVDQSVGSEPVTQTEKKFVSEFPPENVYRGAEKVEEYLGKLSNGRIKTVEELIYVFTHNANPAVSPLLELVDDEPLEPTAYKSVIASLNTFFAKAAKENAEKQGGAESLFDILRAPAEASPYSLEGQLQFILDKWGNLLGETFVARIVRGMDFLREEVIRKNMAHGDFKPDVPLQSFSGGEYQEYERYSPDKEWMPRDERQAVGIMEAISEPYSNPKEDNKRFIVVDMKYKKSLKRPVTLDEIKKQKKFQNWELIRISRLSVMPVPKHIWDSIIDISPN